MWILIFFGGVLLLLYATYVMLFFTNQERMIFPATTRTTAVNLERLPFVVEQPVIQSGQFTSHPLYLPPANRTEHSAPAIVLAHGNGELAEDWLEPASIMQAQGVAVLILEYPGYGYASGAPSTEGMYAAATAAFEWLLSKPEIDPNRIVLIGQSIGSVPTTELARLYPDQTAGLLLISPFVSLRRLARERYLPGWLSRYQFNNLKGLESVNVPVQVWHGTADTLIPPEHGQLLAERAPQGSFVPFDCGHSLCISSWDQFWERKTPFLIETGILEPSA